MAEETKIKMTDEHEPFEVKMLEKDTPPKEYTLEEVEVLIASRNNRPYLGKITIEFYMDDAVRGKLDMVANVKMDIHSVLMTPGWATQDAITVLKLVQEKIIR